MSRTRRRLSKLDGLYVQSDSKTTSRLLPIISGSKDCQSRVRCLNLTSPNLSIQRSIFLFKTSSAELRSLRVTLPFLPSIIAAVSPRMPQPDPNSRMLQFRCAKRSFSMVNSLRCMISGRCRLRHTPASQTWPSILSPMDSSISRWGDDRTSNCRILNGAEDSESVNGKLITSSTSFLLQLIEYWILT